MIIFQDVIASGKNCSHAEKNYILYFMKCCNWYDCIRVCGLEVESCYSKSYAPVIYVDTNDDQTKTPS